MPDVRLPNGTVVKNVPAGTSQDQLVGMLKAAGKDTSWYKPAPPSGPAQAYPAGQPPAAQTVPAADKSMEQPPPVKTPQPSGASTDLPHWEPQDPKGSYRGTVLPVLKTPDKKWHLAWPRVAVDTVNAAVDALNLPKQAAEGRADMSQKGLAAGATNMALMFGPGGAAARVPRMAAQRAAGTAALADGAKAVEQVLSPTTVSREAGTTEGVIRRATGEGGLQSEKAAARLVKYNAKLGNLPVPAQRAFVDYVENRSKYPNAKLQDPELQAAADDLAKVYGDYRNRVESILGPHGPSFVKDYYAHMWKENPTVVGERMNAIAKQGSGRNLKKRSIPTIEEGIQAGLTPKFENPIDTTMAYAQNMSRFLATHDMQKDLRSLGYAKWFKPGSAPSGWVPLNGIMTEKAIAYSKKGAAQGEAPIARQIKLYAPPDVARVYNNFISKGMEQGDIAPFYRGARALSNGLTQLKLGLSAFHLMTMANEGVISEIARGYQALSRGRPLEAGAAFGKSLAAPVSLYRRGSRVERELLDKAVPDSLSKKVNDAFVRSGGQLRMDPFYRSRGAGSFFNAWEKGTFRKELGQAFDEIYKGTPYEKAKGTVDLAANILQTTAAPLFEKYIPRIKRGAFATRMEDWLRANPNATQTEIDQAAIKVSDSIDNRFGELVQDNLFWHKAMKQMSQLLMLSATWNLGTVREIGGGLRDLIPSAKGILSGKGITERTAYVAALATWVPLMNSIMTYLKTGTPPQGKDYMAYRTGGRDAVSGKPERAMVPGYQKDVYAFGYDFPNNVPKEIGNKLNPGIQTVIGLLQNKDYRGLPIYRPDGATPVPGEPGLGDFAIETLMPISFSQFKRNKGSNISTAERALAIRSAPGYITDPERQERFATRSAQKAWQRRLKSDRRLQERQQQ